MTCALRLTVGMLKSQKGSFGGRGPFRGSSRAGGKWEEAVRTPSASSLPFPNKVGLHILNMPLPRAAQGIPFSTGNSLYGRGAGLTEMGLTSPNRPTRVTM